jgi:hypothetical protein
MQDSATGKFGAPLDVEKAKQVDLINFYPYIREIPLSTWDILGKIIFIYNSVWCG